MLANEKTTITFLVKKAAQLRIFSKQQIELLNYLALFCSWKKPLTSSYRRIILQKYVLVISREPRSRQSTTS